MLTHKSEFKNRSCCLHEMGCLDIKCHVVVHTRCTCLSLYGVSVCPSGCKDLGRKHPRTKGHVLGPYSEVQSKFQDEVQRKQQAALTSLVWLLNCSQAKITEQCHLTWTEPYTSQSVAYIRGFQGSFVCPLYSWLDWLPAIQLIYCTYIENIHNIVLQCCCSTMRKKQTLCSYLKRFQL